MFMSSPELLAKPSPIALGCVFETFLQVLKAFMLPLVEHLVKNGVRHATNSSVRLQIFVTLTFVAGVVDVLLLTMHLDDGLQVLTHSTRHMVKVAPAAERRRQSLLTLLH